MHYRKSTCAVMQKLCALKCTLAVVQLFYYAVSGRYDFLKNCFALKLVMIAEKVCTSPWRKFLPARKEGGEMSYNAHTGGSRGMQL